MLLGKKLFEICRLDKFWQGSGEKIRKLQDYPVTREDCAGDATEFWVY